MSSRGMALIENQAISTLTGSIEEMRNFGLDVSLPPVPIVELCQLLQLSVNPEFHLQSQGAKLSGLLRPLEKAIYYEASDILGRQHFSIAHELGHYILHWPEQQRKYKGKGEYPDAVEYVDTEAVFTRLLEYPEDEIDTETGVYLSDSSGIYTIRTHEIETQANYFAQFIMLPENLIRAAAQAIIGLPYATAKHVLAHQFEVSDSAMDLRLRQLGLLTEFEHHQERNSF